MQRQLSRERHSSMSYCNWCPLWENFCCKIVAMRLIKKKKKAYTYTKGAIGCYFCPFLFPSKNTYLNRICTLFYFSNANAERHTNLQRDSWSIWNQVKRDKSGVWEVESDGKASTGLLLRAKLLFWWVSFSPKLLSLKKGRMMETAVVNCQLTPFFNEFLRSLWLSYPGDSGRVSINSSWGCQNKNKGSIFWLMKIIIMYRWKQREKAKCFHVTLNKEELRPYLNYALALQCEMVMQN